MPKVTIETNICIACGLCYEDNCPDVFEEGEEGKSRLKAAFQKDVGESSKEKIHQGEIPESILPCVQQAEEACPVSAIAVK